jgi:hypothetical protein
MIALRGCFSLFIVSFFFTSSSQYQFVLFTLFKSTTKLYRSVPMPQRNKFSGPHTLPGGVPRFYRGVLPALFQGPLSRFGDTAANTGILTALNSLESTKDVNIGFKTMAASAAAALFRIVIMPIDTVKTTMQVTGKFSSVVDKVKVMGPLALYNGSLAAASATFVGHYPWFFTYNFLSEKIPKQDTQLAELGRRAILGFSASAISDTCSNSIRVVKVYKQSHRINFRIRLRMVVRKLALSVDWKPRFSWFAGYSL